MLVIVLEKDVSEETILLVKNELIRLAGTAFENRYPGQFELLAPGISLNGAMKTIRSLRGVTDVFSDPNPYRMVTRANYRNNTAVSVKGAVFGEKALQVIAGPCSVESRAQILDIAHEVKEAGATVLRGGAFKPRSSPYSFQGLGVPALEYLAEAREATGLPVVTEVIHPADIERVVRYADILQVGSRNSQNIPLLQELGKTSHPVILKRGMMMTVEEWLMAAEYVLLNGNRNVILCERGIRTFETTTRNTLDLSSVPVVNQASHLPVIVDPSHAAGRSDIIPALSRAALASGADGLMLEVHPRPEEALSDSAQAVTPCMFAELMKSLQQVAAASGRTL